MKKLFFLIFIVAIVLDTTGGSNSAAVANNNADSTRPDKALFARADNAVFSYNLDGVKISGGVVDELLMNNTAWVTESGNSKKLQFFLNDTYNEKTEMFAHSLRFTIPDKTGTVTMNADDDNWHVALFLAAGAAENYSLYANTSFTITVTNLSSTRVAGTFSGKVKLTESQRSGKTDFTILSGHFDIPVRTAKK